MIGHGLLAPMTYYRSEAPDAREAWGRHFDETEIPYASGALVSLDFA